MKSSPAEKFSSPEMRQLLHEELDRLRMGHNWIEVNAIAGKLSDVSKSSEDKSLALSALAQASYWTEGEPGRSTPSSKVLSVLDSAIAENPHSPDAIFLSTFFDLIQILPRSQFGPLSSKDQLIDRSLWISKEQLVEKEGNQIEYYEPEKINAVISKLRQMKWDSEWETQSFISKFPFRYLMLVISRIWLGFCLNLLQKYQEALEIYNHSLDILVKFLVYSQSTHSSLSSIQEIIEISQNNILFQNQSLLDLLLEKYREFVEPFGIGIKFGDLINRIIPSKKNTKSTSQHYGDLCEDSIPVKEKFPSDQKITSKAHDTKDLIIIFCQGELFISLVSTISKLRWQTQDFQGFLDIYRSCLDLTGTKNVVETSYHTISMFFYQNRSHPITTAIRSLLLLNFGTRLQLSVPRGRYRTVDLWKSDNFKTSETSDSQKSSSEFEEAILAFLISLEEIPKVFPFKSPLTISANNRLCLGFSICKKYSATAELLRESVANDVENSSLWYKLTLALLASREYDESYLAIRHCLHLSQNDVNALLLASKICLNFLGRTQMAVQYAKQALEALENPGLKLVGKSLSGMKLLCKFTYGVCCAKFAYEVSTFSTRNSLQEEALSSLLEVHESSPHNPKAAFHLALIQADIREISSSIRSIKISLQCDSTNVDYWNLLVLLLSANKSFRKAYITLNAAIEQCGEVKQLLFTKAKVLMQEAEAVTDAQSVFSNASVILSTLKKVVLAEFGSNSVKYFQFRDLMIPYFLSNGSSEVHAEVALENHPKNVLKSYVHATAKFNDPNAFKYQLLLSISDYYIRLYKESKDIQLSHCAFTCLNFARDLGSSAWLPDIYCNLAMICEATDDLDSAQIHYENALAFDATHTRSLVRMGATSQKVNYHHIYFLPT